MGRDLLFLVSRSGNQLGAKWLQSVLGDEYRVHTTSEIYRSSHIDSTVVCLRPGLALINGERVAPDICPPVLNKWERLYVNEIVDTPAEVVELAEKLRKPIYRQLAAMNVYTNLDSIVSKWVGMNLLSVDPNTVLVDERQGPFMKLLEKRKFTVVPIRFRHAYFMLGGLHCSTLDTVRDSKLESYFD